MLTILAGASRNRILAALKSIDGISEQPWPHEDVFPYVKTVHEAFGAARMLGCTGFPEDPQRGEAVGFRVIEEEIDFLAVEDKEWILGKTADLLYGLKGD